MARAGLAIGLAFGLLFGLIGLLIGLTEGLLYGLLGLGLGLLLGLAVGLVGGLVVGVPIGLVGVWRVPLATMSDVTPRLVYQKDVRSHLLSGLMVGLATGIVVCFLAVLVALPVAVAFLFIEGRITLVPFGVALLFGWAWIGLALPLGLASGLVSGFRAGAAPSLLFTELALWPRGRRVRFMPLLETALARQVLRQAGAVYQFRHADLQDRLADQYEAGLTSDRAAPS
jgi:hypothetical protein